MQAAIVAGGVLMLWLSRLVFARPKPSPLDPMFRRMQQVRPPFVFGFLWLMWRLHHTPGCLTFGFHRPKCLCCLLAHPHLLQPACSSDALLPSCVR